MIENSMTMLSYMVVFVFVVLASQHIGTFFARFKFPLITGFLFAGIMAGPYLLKIIPEASIHKLRFVDELALAFIAFAAGSELIVRQIKSRFQSIRFTTLGLVMSTFLLGSFSFYLLSGYLSFTQSMSPLHRLAVSILAGAILVARSPSSAIAVVNELRAKGPFTKTALGVTVIMDVVVITLFSINASIADTLLTGQQFNITFFGILFIELVLSLIFGFLLSKILNFILSWHCRRSLKTGFILAMGFGVFTLSAMIRQATHDHLVFEIFIEPMLICMMASFLTANYSPYRTELMKVLHDIAPFVYVAFFTLTGASLRLDVLADCWLIALILFGIRIMAIFIGAFSGGYLAGDPMRYNKIAWMSYITQAGVGLGLAKEVMVAFPEWGATFATIIISVIVLNQIVGPPFFKWALHLVGEAHPKGDGHTHDEIRDAVIFGLEGESFALARLLQSNGWEVKIAGTKQRYVEEMASESDIEIHAITELSIEALDKLGVGNANSIVTMLSDEENYSVCELIYENYGTRNIIVRLNHREHFKRFHQLGVSVVEPSTAIVNLMDQFVRSPSAARLLLGLEKGREVIEFELRNPDLKGLTIRDLNLPLDLHIISIRRSGQLIFAGGFTRFEMGDRLTVVGMRTSLEQMMLQFGESREHEMLHMVERATPKEMVSNGLNKEVKEILHDHDTHRKERFNQLIEESTVLDIESAMPFDELFEKVAETMAVDLNGEKEILFKLLMEREKEFSTALRPDLAIPHIIIEGDKTFRILLVRCKEGIYFSEIAPRVHTVFVLAGTIDQRNFHLYVLSAIAEIVQRKHFQERWMKARSKTALRHISQIR